MKKKLLVALIALAVLAVRLPSFGQDDSKLQGEIKDFVTQVQARIGDGKRSEADYADLFKKADDLVAEHKSEKTDAVAQIVFLKAMLYVEILHDSAKGIESIEQIKKDFPDTKQGKSADGMIAKLKQNLASDKIQAGLADGAAFPAFSETDFDGKPLALASHKGKIVLIDFWATWCGPCRAEFPNVKKTYDQYHDKGFDIVGVSLDEDKAKLADFIKENGVVWPQYFDGLGWGNKLATNYGVQSIPATFLLDKDGKILGRDLRGDALTAAVAKALAVK